MFKLQDPTIPLALSVHLTVQTRERRILELQKYIANLVHTFTLMMLRMSFTVQLMLMRAQLVFGKGAVFMSVINEHKSEITENYTRW